MDSSDDKKTSACLTATHSAGPGADLAGGGEIPGSPACRGAFDAFGLLQDFELGTGDSNPAIVAILIQHIELDRAVGADIRIWVHQQAIEDTKDSGGGADAEGEGKDGGQCEAGLLAKLPEEEQEVVPHVFPLYTLEKRFG
jgi:hypothetical protein